MTAAEQKQVAARQGRLEDFAARTVDPAQRAAVDAAAGEVIAAFDRARVPLLLLKGPALAARLYRQDEQRGYFDVDFLVAPVDRDRAGALLVDLGYRNATARRGVDDLTGVIHADTWIRGNDVGVDLHTRLPGCLATPAAAWERLRVDSDAIDVGGHRVAILGRSALALHLAIHAAQHGPSDLKAIGDLRRGIERWTLEDWRAAAAIAKELRATAALTAGLRLIDEGAALAVELGLAPSALADWEVRNPHLRPRGASHLDAFVRARGVRSRARLVRRALLPHSRWIAWEYPWSTANRLCMTGGYALHLARAPSWAARALRYWVYCRRIKRAAQATLQSRS